MERKLSGIDLIEMRQFKKEQSILEADEYNIIDREEIQKRVIEIKQAMMDPLEGDMEHMFTADNKLYGNDGKPVDDMKGSKWTHILHAVKNWGKY